MKPGARLSPTGNARVRRFGAICARTFGVAAGGLLCGLPVGPVHAQQTTFVVPSVPGGGFNVPMSTMLDRRFYTVVRQQYDYSCGSASLATLLRYHYGVQIDEQVAFAGMWDQGDQAAIRQNGFSLLDMKRFLEANDLAADGFRVSLDQVAQTGVPGIALTVTKGYRHFVVIKGVSDRSVLVGDPSRGLVRYSREEFSEIWDGLFFVIVSAREIGSASFNRQAQWSAVGAAPVQGPQSRPTEMETVRTTVTVPFLGEL